MGLVNTFSNSMRAEYGDWRRSSRMTFFTSTSTNGNEAVLGVIGDDIVFSFLVDHGPLNIAVEEIESVGLIALDGEAITAEIQFRPAR